MGLQGSTFRLPYVVGLYGAIGLFQGGAVGLYGIGISSFASACIDFSLKWYINLGRIFAHSTVYDKVKNHCIIYQITTLLYFFKIIDNLLFLHQFCLNLLIMSFQISCFVSVVQKSWISTCEVIFVSFFAYIEFQRYMNIKNRDCTVIEWFES